MNNDRRIRIGNQTAFSAESVTLPFEFAVDHGFDAFEWFPDKKESGEGWTVRDIPAEVRSSIRKTAAAHDIRLSVHAPWPSDPLSGDAVPSFHEAIGFAEEIGASLFTVHFRTDRGIEAYAEALRPFMNLLKEAGIGLAIENTVSTSPQDITALFRRLSRFGGDAISHAGMCIDVGHANLYCETRNDYLRFFDMLGPEVPIVHVHMHENYGDQDKHLTIFTGPASRDISGISGFVERLLERNFSGCIILEQWPTPASLLVEARNRLIEIIAATPGIPRTGNNGAEEKDIVGKFAEANGRFLSWRKRLDWVLHLLIDASGGPDLDLLAYIAIYLRFMGTGEIRCGEDGGHYRPSHHAKISERIYRRLVKFATPENFFVLRKIYPWLPSFDSEFMRAEPLTLIRDIAHRNDIPPELKQEIKTSLQNKLHRSAGPEDLAVSGALLEKIAAPGASYPEAFVAEFRRFHEELKDFFSAGSLRELLSRIIGRKEFGDIPLLRRFVATLDHPGKGGEAIKELELLTDVRTRLGPKILGDATAAGHRLQLADIRLEDHCFALLSLIINDIEDHLNGRQKMPWEQVLRTSLLAVANIRLGGFDPEECAAIEAELNSVCSVFDPGRREHLLRLRATADRCRRLADAYRDKVLALFPEKAERLGQALGVAKHAVRVYAEADIRSHPVFQLSKLVSLLLTEIRERASLPLWDVIVPGSATGKLLVVPSLSSLPVAHKGAVIVLSDRAEGDEEIPTYVTGIIVTAETPFLSHLAVRARQEGTVFVSCEEPKRTEEIRGFSGRPLSIAVSGEDFVISPAEPGGNGEPDRECVKTAGVIELSVEDPEQATVALDRIAPSTGGGKAHGARRLGEIAAMQGAGFAVPSGLVIPFGVMEGSLRLDPALAEEYRSLAKELDISPQARQDNTLERLTDIVLHLSLPGEIPDAVAAKFGGDSRVMVRSSSNCEDAEGLAGAGLYDSVANVPLSEIGPAIRRVWASFWNRRALDARRNAGIPHERCRMAVLIQAMMAPDLSFIMHTVNPVNGNEDEILIELAVGLGETLASGREPGSPFRMAYHKKTGDIEILSFANYSFLLRPADHGGTVRERVDYSAISFSGDDDFRRKLAIHLGEVGGLVERAFGKPMDVEGLVRNETIYLVQARPQLTYRHTGRKGCPT
jgi:phosphoglucan,water dikinase